MTDNFSVCHLNLKRNVDETKLRFISLLKKISLLCNTTATIIGDLNQKLLDISIRSDLLHYKIHQIYRNFHKELKTGILEKPCSDATFIKNLNATGESTNIGTQESNAENFDIETLFYKANIFICTSMSGLNKANVTVHNVFYPVKANSKTHQIEKSKKSLNNNERVIYTRRELHKCLMKAILRGVKLKKVNKNKFIKCEYNDLKANINELISKRLVGQDVKVEDEDQNSLESWDTSS